MTWLEFMRLSWDTTVDLGNDKIVALRRHSMLFGAACMLSVVAEHYGINVDVFASQIDADDVLKALKLQYKAYTGDTQKLDQ